MQTALKYQEDQVFSSIATDQQSDVTALDPLFAHAVQSVLELDARGVRLDINVRDVPYNALVTMAEKLRDFGVSNNVAQSMIDALETQATQLGVDFTRNEKPTPLEVSVRVADCRPDLDNSKTHFMVAFDGQKKFGSEYSTVEAHLTNQGTKLTTTNVPALESMFTGGGEKYVIMHFEKLAPETLQGFEEGGMSAQAGELSDAGVAAVELLEAAGPGANPAALESIRQTIEQGTITPQQTALIQTVGALNRAVETIARNPEPDAKAPEIIKQTAAPVTKALQTLTAAGQLPAPVMLDATINALQKGEVAVATQKAALVQPQADNTNTLTVVAQTPEAPAVASPAVAVAVPTAPSVSEPAAVVATPAVAVASPTVEVSAPSHAPSETLVAVEPAVAMVGSEISQAAPMAIDAIAAPAIATPAAVGPIQHDSIVIAAQGAEAPTVVSPAIAVAVPAAPSVAEPTIIAPVVATPDVAVVSPTIEVSAPAHAPSEILVAAEPTMTVADLAISQDAPSVVEVAVEEVGDSHIDLGVPANDVEIRDQAIAATPVPVEMGPVDVSETTVVELAAESPVITGVEKTPIAPSVASDFIPAQQIFTPETAAAPVAVETILVKPSSHVEHVSPVSTLVPQGGSAPSVAPPIVSATPQVIAAVAKQTGPAEAVPAAKTQTLNAPVAKSSAMAATQEQKSPVVGKQTPKIQNKAAANATTGKVQGVVASRPNLNTVVKQQGVTLAHQLNPNDLKAKQEAEEKTESKEKDKQRNADARIVELERAKEQDAKEQEERKRADRERERIAREMFGAQMYDFRAWAEQSLAGNKTSQQVAVVQDIQQRKPAFGDGDNRITTGLNLKETFKSKCEGCGGGACGTCGTGFLKQPERAHSPS